MSTGTESELFWEARVADSLGVARKVIAGLRRAHLTPGEHFAKRQNSVVLTAAGLARLAELVKADGAATFNGEKPAMPPGPRPRGQMVTIKAPLNKRLLWCHRKGDKARRQVLVRVTSNENFMPGMEFEAVDGGENLWQYTGRLPRRRGRW